MIDGLEIGDNLGNTEVLFAPTRTWVLPHVVEEGEHDRLSTDRLRKTLESSDLRVSTGAGNANAVTG